MDPEPLIRWGWRERSPVPEPGAVVAWGLALAQRLLARLAQTPRPQLDALSVVALDGGLVVLGPATQLPWLDGVAFAAVCAEAPALWLPTWTRPEVPLDLLARAFVASAQCEPVLLWPEPAVVVPLNQPVPLTLHVLAELAARWPALP